ncbi:MAG: PilN domain-containing protein [Desulfobacterales bacterium]|nr:MAG: PilN domain-containing protein [Desulfobacterales bacterium]
MIRINLLPFRAARKKENIRRQVSVFVLSLILVLILLVFYNFQLGGKIGKLNAKVQDTKTELEKYNKINKKIDRIKKDLAKLKTQMAIIEQLEANRHAPVRLLETLTEMVVEKRMWFTSLDDKGDRVNINGIALDNKTVADFMLRLERCGLFSNVNLRTLKHKRVQKANLKSFQINCKKRPTGKPTDKNIELAKG